MFSKAFFRLPARICCFAYCIYSSLKWSTYNWICLNLNSLTTWIGWNCTCPLHHLHCDKLLQCNSEWQKWLIDSVCARAARQNSLKHSNVPCVCNFLANCKTFALLLRIHLDRYLKSISCHITIACLCTILPNQSGCVYCIFSLSQDWMWSITCNVQWEWSVRFSSDMQTNVGFGLQQESLSCWTYGSSLRWRCAVLDP